MPIMDTLKNAKMENVLTTRVAANNIADAENVAKKLQEAEFPAKVVFTSNPDPLCFVHVSKTSPAPNFSALGIAVL